MERLNINLNNIHCQDCENNIFNIISLFVDLKRFGVDGDEGVVSDSMAVLRISDNQVEVSHDKNDFRVLEHNVKKIIKQLGKAGFNVLSWEYYCDNVLVLDSQTKTKESKAYPDIIQDLMNTYGEYRDKKSHKSHIKNCPKCAEELEQKKKQGSNSFDESFETRVDKPNKDYRLLLYIGGMTCASCVQSVESAIEQQLKELKLPIEDENHEPNFSVNLMQHTGVVIIPNKQIVNKIVDSVSDTGFECKVLEILPVERTINTKVTAAIGGITCSACATSIQSAVNDLSFIFDCSVNIVTKSAKFLMEDSPENMETLKQTVEDCGFDFTVLSKDEINYTHGKKSSRTVNISVSHMFCNHCPEVITNYLESYGQAIVIEDKLTLDHPFIKFSYIPNVQKKLTLRNILFCLNHLKASDNSDGYIIDETTKGSFDCELVKQISMDEHLRKLAKKEVMHVVRRLVIAIVFTIPTFIIGVVAMNLLDDDNSFKQWVDSPLWTGNVSTDTWILFFLSTPVYFFAADIFHRKALTEIRSLWIRKNSFKKRFFKFGSMNLLVSTGTSVAYISSIVLLILGSQSEPHEKAFHTTYFDSVVFLTFFLLIGKLLESISKSKTANAVSGLNSMKVSEATLVERIKHESNDSVSYENDEVVPVNMLEVDDFIRLASGQSPPVDCVIMENSSEFDESAITGESIPVPHFPGHQIFAGTVNVGNSTVIAKIVSLESESLIDQILNTVRDSQLRKAPIERLADKLTGFFVPVIVFVSIVVMVIWLSLSYSGSLPDHYLDVDVGGWAMWSIEFSISVFVVACPCGIGLAAPTALFVGSGIAARYGILAKGGGTAFQDAANTSTICFDKTGTLTFGEPRVIHYGFVVSDNRFVNEIKTMTLQIARDLEVSSKHPLASAIRQFITEVGFKTNDVVQSSNKIPSVENVAGRGLKGDIVLNSSSEDMWQQLKPTRGILGNEAFFKENGVVINDKQQQIFDEWKTNKESLSLVGVECEAIYGDKNIHLVGAFGCKDQIRSEAKSVINYLQNKSNIDCWMITGDNRLTAESVGREVGVKTDRIISDVLPNDKQAKVKSIQLLDTRRVVAMIGDGINDGPALAAADLGIALASGTDLAMTTSDFILLNKVQLLRSVVTLFDLSKTVFRRVKFNFAWALVYNIIGVPIAAGVIYPYHNSRLGPAWASAAMAASSVSVVLSSLALKFYKPKIKDQVDLEVEEEEVSLVEL